MSEIPSAIIADSPPTAVRTRSTFGSLAPGDEITDEYLSSCRGVLEARCKEEPVLEDALDGRELMGVILGHVLRDTPNWQHNWSEYVARNKPFPKDTDLPFSFTEIGATFQGFLEHIEALKSTFADVQNKFCGTWAPNQHSDVPNHLLPPFYTHRSSLGVGTFAIVDEVVLIGGSSNSENIRYARKRPIQSGECNAQLEKELKVLRSITKHHHVVQCVGSYRHKGFINILLTPVADSNLRTYLEATASPESFKWKRKKRLLMRSFGCLISGLGFLTMSMRHKDIKPGNILVHDDTVLFTDFGSAHNFGSTGVSSATSNTFVGNINWMYAAPEVVETKGTRDVKSDLFSLGCVFSDIIAVLAQREPFMEHMKLKNSNSSKKRFGQHVPQLHDWLDSLRVENPELCIPIDLCKEMTQKELAQRPIIPDMISKLKERCESEGKLEEYFCSKCQNHSL